ncbi:hypothetical protein NDU88_002889 [Pleurodeles waltl]|uniref:Uncharacterized protein n=1 Tax=Pleurodeles waltl TaxID=8319 RepID=A0AAV7UCD9_PLEWA|nr:hypothetical protein NDU88_002889 [Pleurodeles waltl]
MPTRPRTGGGSGPSGVRARLLINQSALEGLIPLHRRCPVSATGKPACAPAPPIFCCPVYAVFSGIRFLARSSAAGLWADCRDQTVEHLPRIAQPNPTSLGLQSSQGGGTARAQARPASRSKHQAL